MKARIAAVVVLVAAVVAVVVLARSGSPYELHVRLQNASQLAKGNLVEVGGHRIGTVTAIELADDNEADITIAIDEDRFTPLHAGTTAFVRVPSLSGVANRYIELHPGPNNGPALSEGAVIPSERTDSTVELDALQSTLDADTRARLQGVIRGGAAAYAGGGSRGFNQALRYLSPALAQTQATFGQIVADRGALQRFIVASSDVVRTVAARTDDLTQGLSSTATTAGALAAESRSLRGVLRRAPGSLDVATGTLRELSGTLDEVTPTARAAQPSAPRLSRLLETATPALERSTDVLPRLRRVLGPLRQVLEGLPELGSTGVPAMRQATSSIAAAQPIVEGTRPYLPDLWLGATNGFGGTASGYYDANGEYGRIAFVGGPYSISGPGSLLPSPDLGTRYGNWKRCPGAATQIAEDGSNKVDAPGCEESQRP